jgi:aspartate racemase
MGPSATVDFMQKIIRNTPAKTDQDHMRMIVEHNPYIPDRTTHLLKNGEDPTHSLLTCAKNLEHWGADFIVIPCNTAHAYVRTIQVHISVPIIHMIEEVLLHVQKNYPGTTRIGLLATTGTVMTDVYRHIFEKSGIKLIYPKEKYQGFVMEAIYGKNGVKAGFTKGKPKELLQIVAEELVKQCAQMLILGCTELPLILDDEDRLGVDAKKVPVLDATDVLANKCVDVILGLNNGKQKAEETILA